jgi:DNA-binding MarR family transcriptional regulator
MKVLEVELWIDILERPHAARALLILYRYGTLHQSELSNMLSPGSYVPTKRIKELIRAGLIVETVAPEGKRYLMLTEMGQHVGKHLDEIERYIAPEDGEIETFPIELFVR